MTAVYFRPIDVLHSGEDFGGRVSGSESSSDQPAGACARDGTHPEPVVLQCIDHADVGDSPISTRA
jgi:hypothetical protein